MARTHGKDCSLRFVRLCSTFLDFRAVTPENCSLARFTTSDSDPDFCKKSVTGDSTCFAYDPTTKTQSAAWVGENSSRPKKLRFGKSLVHLFIFFSWKGVIHKELFPEDKTVSAMYCTCVMRRLQNRIRRVRPGMCQSGDWFLLHNGPSPNAPSHNAPPHKAPSHNAAFKQFLAQGKATARPPRIGQI